MTEAEVLDLGREALKVCILLAAPLLLGALFAGVAVSIFQAITQVNEATLTFIPKILVVVLILVVGGPWMMETMTDYTTNLFQSMTTIIR